MSYHLNVELIKKEKLKEDIYRYTVRSREIANSALPGQFLEIQCSDAGEFLLRRPISIADIDKEKGTVNFIFQVKGKGTASLTKKEVGNQIDLLGPLGNGTFRIALYKNVAILGGGIGVFPLLELSKRLYPTSSVYTYLGFRNQESVACETDFQKISHQLLIATDDGSYGKMGFAIEYLKKDASTIPFDAIFACGPLPMLKSIKTFAEEHKIPCQISLEEKMACGIGACLGCAVYMPKEEKSTYGHVCKNGPVFFSEEVNI